LALHATTEITEMLRARQGTINQLLFGTGLVGLKDCLHTLPQSGVIGLTKQLH
jgi:hypothetical protein